MDDEFLKILAYVMISSYRVKAIKSLAHGDRTPTQIAHDSGIRPNHISKVLRELKDNGIAECTNEHKRKNRNYKLTELGREIAKEL